MTHQHDGHTVQLTLTRAELDAATSAVWVNIAAHDRHQTTNADTAMTKIRAAIERARNR